MQGQALAEPYVRTRSRENARSLKPQSLQSDLDSTPSSPDTQKASRVTPHHTQDWLPCSMSMSAVSARQTHRPPAA